MARRPALARRLRTNGSAFPLCLQLRLFAQRGQHDSHPGQNMAFTSSMMLRCMSGSSVIGLAIATSQARSIAIPSRIRVPA